MGLASRRFVLEGRDCRLTHGEEKNARNAKPALERALRCGCLCLLLRQVALAFIRSLFLVRGSFLSEREEEEETGELDGGDRALDVEVSVHEGRLLWEAEIALQRLQLQLSGAGLEECANVLPDSHSGRSRSPLHRQSVFGRGRNEGMGNGDDTGDVNASPTAGRVLGAENFVPEDRGLADESGRYSQYGTGALKQDTSRSFVHFMARAGDGFAPPVPPAFFPVERRFSGYQSGPGLPRVVSPSRGSPPRGSTRRPGPERVGECFSTGMHGTGSETGYPLAPGVDRQEARREAQMCSRVSEASCSKERGGLGTEEADSKLAKRKAPRGTPNDGEVHGGDCGGGERGADGTSFGSPGGRTGKLSSRWFGIGRGILGGERWRRIAGAGAACRAPSRMESRRGPENSGGTGDVQGMSAERKEELEHGKGNGPRSCVSPSNAGADGATPDYSSKLPEGASENHRCGEVKVTPGDTSSISVSGREEKSISRVSECTSGVASPGNHVPVCVGVSGVSPGSPSAVGSRSEIRSKPKGGGSLAAIFGRSGSSSRTVGEQSTGGTAPGRPLVAFQTAPVDNDKVTRRVTGGEVAAATRSSIAVDASDSSPGRHNRRSRDGMTVGMSVASPGELGQNAAAIEGAREEQDSGGNPGGGAVSVRPCGDGRGASRSSERCLPERDETADAAASSSVEDDALGEIERGGEGDAAASGPGASSPDPERGDQGLRRGSASIVRRLSFALGLRAEGAVGSRGGKGQSAAAAVAADAEGSSSSVGDLRPPLLLPGLGVRRRGSYAVCPVCLEVFQPMDPVTIITCGHAFHWDCVQPWLERSARCPCCRRDLNVLSAIRVGQQARSTDQHGREDNPFADHSGDYGSADFGRNDGNEPRMNAGSTFFPPGPSASWSRSYEDSDAFNGARLAGAAGGPGRERPRRSSWAPSAGASNAFPARGQASDESQWVSNRPEVLRRSLYSSSLRVTNVSAGRIYSLEAW